MGHWGWRPIMFLTFISVWIVGCADTQSAPTPTPENVLIPPITLIVVTPGLSPTPQSNIIPTVMTPKVNQTVSYTADPLSPKIEIDHPTCYETTNSNILCLGTIHNQSSQAIANTIIHATLFNPDGTRLNQQDITIEQQLIPPDGAAPYRVMFPSDFLQNFGNVSIALPSVSAIDDYLQPTILREYGGMRDSHYVVTARINTSDIEFIRAVATLYNEAGQVVGYRVLELEPDAETVDIQIIVTPQLETGPFHHTLHVEAE